MSFAGPIAFSAGMIVPAVILVALAVIIPRALFAHMQPTLRALGLNMVLSILLLILCAALLFALMYLFQASGVAVALASEPLAALVQFLKLGAASGLIWGPVLLLVLFGLAQRTEA